MKFTVGFNNNALGCVLVELGNTKVLCTASIDKSVPQWLQGGNKGWLTAEYSMLPGSTHTRSKRERERIGGRTHEIQRLIARSLRACIDLKQIPEKSVYVDCDVLQADGGTRTASITGGYVALHLALNKLSLKSALVDQVAAVSVGIKDNKVLVDLDYGEDSSCEVDTNFVMTKGGLFIEVQGTAEQKAFSRDQLNEMLGYAESSIRNMMTLQNQALSQM
jgi:ribonuclease PH